MKFFDKKHIKLNRFSKTFTIIVLFFFILVTAHDGLSIFTNCHHHKVELFSANHISLSNTSQNQDCVLCAILKMISNQFFTENNEPITINTFFVIQFNDNIILLANNLSQPSGRSPPLIF